MSITLTREQLYQRVWETPIDTLRHESGISNVGLGKICRHRQIPMPRDNGAPSRAGHRYTQIPGTTDAPSVASAVAAAKQL